jgi:hypothetical protein
MWKVRSEINLISLSKVTATILSKIAFARRLSLRNSSHEFHENLTVGLVTGARPQYTNRRTDMVLAIKYMLKCLQISPGKGQ